MKFNKKAVSSTLIVVILLAVMALMTLNYILDTSSGFKKMLGME